MKVLFGSFSAVTVLGGGVEVQMRSLAREVGKLGIEVEFFDSWKRYNLSDYAVFHLFGSHVGTYHLGRAMHGLGMRLFVTPVFYSRHAPQRVAAGVAVAARLRAKGGFWTEHMFCRELCDMAEMVLPDTRDEMDMMARAFGVPAQKMRELPNGVEERFLHATPDLFVKEYGLKDFLLYVGHIGPGRKNVLPMLKAAAKLNVPTVLIGPVGTNDYARKCRQIVADSPNIKLIPGFNPESPMLESAYAACDTLILPAFYETPGLAALEAALAGAKVCITQYGGTKEYFAEHATYLEPNSEQSIADAIKESIAKPKAPALRERVHSNYLWRNAGEILAQTYRDTTTG